MRTRTILVAAAAPAALAAALLGASPAFASSGPAPSNGGAGHLTGNAAISYQDPYFGGVQCNENQHPQFDNVTCKFVTNATLGLTSWAGNFTVGKTDQVGWISDFGGNGTAPANGVAPVHHQQGTLTYTITGDATTGQVTGYTGQVTYPAS